MISDKLLALRKRSGMSQQEVASAIGVTRQTISNWELGQGSPALDKAAELARLYGVTLDDLANDEVDVVTSGKGERARDLHVLKGLVGKIATVELADGEGALEHALILDVGAGWIRLECDAPKAVFPTPIFREKEPARRVLKLVDMADVIGFAIEEGER